jgi:hypothetical protein
LRNRIDRVSKKDAKMVSAAPSFRSHFGTKSNKHLRKKNFQNVHKSVTEKPEKKCKNDAKRDPEIIDFQFDCERMHLGNSWFYTVKRTILRIKGPKIHIKS